MRSEKKLLKRLNPYGSFDYIYWKNKGYLAWHLSTGENYEMLFLEVKEKKKGVATQLFREFVKKVKPPFNSVFAFRRADNKEAEMFYGKLGFKQMEIPGIYRWVSAVIMWIRFSELRRRCK